MDWLAIDRLSAGHDGRIVIRDLSLSVPRECRILAVMGASGVGKSTLLSVMAGHLPPSQGSIRICGERVEEPSGSRPMVFQDHNLFPWKTVSGNIQFGLKCLGVPARIRAERARELLDRMRLAGVAQCYPSQLSGGMRQRVGLARAMILRAPCLLLDEPFNALDTDVRELLQDELVRHVVETGTHAVLVTHDLAEAVYMADAVLVLRGGADFDLLPVSETPLPQRAAWRAGTMMADAVLRLRRAIAGAPGDGDTGHAEGSLRRPGARRVEPESV